MQQNDPTMSPDSGKNLRQCWVISKDTIAEYQRIHKINEDRSSVVKNHTLNTLCQKNVNSLRMSNSVDPKTFAGPKVRAIESLSASFSS